MRPTTVFPSAIVMFTMAVAAAPAHADPHRAGASGRAVHAAAPQGVAVQRSVVARPAVVARSTAVARPVVVARPAGVARPVVVAPRAAARPVVVAPRVIAPRVVVAPYRFYRPYYTFHPHVSLGFGLFVGYPVPYPYFYGPYPYPATYPVPVPYPAGYPAPPSSPSASSPAYPQSGNGVSVQPGAANSAGLSFEITPADAEVYVDGGYIGHVSDFGPQSAPLSVTPGRHRVEIRRSGYQALSFDADAIAGQVIPYQGTMQANH
jgi:PEGA domain